MKNIAILFCLMPWIVLGLALLILPVEYFQPNKTCMLFGTLWVVISPGVTAIAMWVAYKEGQLSIRFPS